MGCPLEDHRYLRHATTEAFARSQIERNSGPASGVDIEARCAAETIEQSIADVHLRLERWDQVTAITPTAGARDAAQRTIGSNHEPGCQPTGHRLQVHPISIMANLVCWRRKTGSSESPRQGLRII